MSFSLGVWFLTKVLQRDFLFAYIIDQVTANEIKLTYLVYLVEINIIQQTTSVGITPKGKYSRKMSWFLFVTREMHKPYFVIFGT